MVGVARSGTTLLRLMLDAHPALAIPPETHFIPKLSRALEEGESSVDAAIGFLTTRRRWGDFGIEAADLRALVGDGETTASAVTHAFYDLYAQMRGKPRWGDKTPPYVARMPRVQSVVGEARFVHLIRDGRAVALSLGEAHFGPEGAGEAAEVWAKRIKRARRMAPRLDHYMEARYEELVADPEPLLRRICDFVELDFDAAMLAYEEGAAGRMGESAREMRRADGTVISAEMRAGLHERTSSSPDAERGERWREELSPEQLRAVEDAAGDVLAELGYR